MWSDNLPREIVGMHMSEAVWHVADLHDVPWVQFLAVVDPAGRSFSEWSDRGHSVICRLRTGGWGTGGGTIPIEEEYEEGAVRTAAFVAASSGCHIWGIGNEPNIKWERPNGVPITPEKYADYYVKVEKYIHAIPGRAGDWVMPAAVATWNVDTTYEGNEIGDWVLYYGDMIRLILEKGGRIDAVQLHTYTHGASPALVPSLAKMAPPFEERYYNFLAFYDFMQVTPISLHAKPFFITETNQDKESWLNTGWIREAFYTIDSWNQDEDIIAKIWAMFTFRYEDEMYGMKQHPSVMDEFHSVVEIGYTRPEEEPMPERILYQSSFENGFHPQDGETHVMVPTGWMADWDEDFGKRPEFKPKDKEQGHPEVRTGRFAAGFFHVSTRFAGVLFKQFTVTPNVPVRVEVWCMGVHSSGQAAGMSIGIFNAPDFFSSDQQWKEWWSPNMPEYQDRAWKKIEASGVSNASGKFYVALLGRADEAIPDWNTHWDDPVVYVTDDSGPVDPPVDPPEGGIMDHVTAARAELDAIEAIVANPFLCIRA